MDELRELYQEIILDHGKHPRNFRRTEHPTHMAHGNNPMCGDVLDVFLEVGLDGVVRDVSFVGRGCAISVASASLMTEIVKGKTVEQADRLFQALHAICTSDEPPPELPEFADDLERLRVLGGVRQFPVRVKCATLPWHTMKAAVAGGVEASTE